MIHVVGMGSNNLSDTPEEKRSKNSLSPIRIFRTNDSCLSRPAIVTVELIQIVIVPIQSLTSSLPVMASVPSFLASEPIPVQW